jgi:hypothetical protein
VALMMPAVTVSLSPKGLPMATRAADLDGLAEGEGRAASPVRSTLTTATSLSSSAAHDRPVSSVPSYSRTSTWSVPSTTWAAVMMKPFLS